MTFKYLTGIFLVFVKTSLEGRVRPAVAVSLQASPV